MPISRITLSGHTAVMTKQVSPLPALLAVSFDSFDVD